MKKTVVKYVWSLLIVLALIFSMCSCGHAKLSESIIGEWTGQVDVAKMIYQELGDELGLELSPEPAYCSVTLSFDEGGEAVMKIDQEEFAQAVGQCASPFTSALLGFDTDSLVSLLMQYVSKDMSEESGTDEFTYTVDDENNTVTFTDESGETTVMQLNDDGQLEYDAEEISQVVVFEKE